MSSSNTPNRTAEGPSRRRGIPNSTQHQLFPSSPSSQFAQTPRFSTPYRSIQHKLPPSSSSSSQALAVDPKGAPLSQFAPLPIGPRRRSGLPLTRVESIEDEFQEVEEQDREGHKGDERDQGGEDPYLLDPGTRRTPKLRRGRQHPSHGAQEPWTFEVTQSPKRRRLSPSSISDGLFVRQASQATASKTALELNTISPFTPTPNFRLAPTTLTQTLTPGPKPSTHPTPIFRPSFARASHSQAAVVAAAASPLPDVFSPSRKDQRDVPGGLAAELRCWIAEAASAAVVARSWDTGGEGAADAAKAVVVEEACGAAVQDDDDNDDERRPRNVGRSDARGMMTFVRSISHEAERDGGISTENIVLTGPARTAKMIRKHDVVRLWAPYWQIELGDKQTWTVGVDWSISSASHA